MSALGRIVQRSIENPQVPISSATIGTIFGESNAAGVPVSEARAYGLTAYYRAVSLISSTLASLPLKVYDYDTRAVASQDIRVLRYPNAAQTRFEFWQTMYANALTWGNAYAIKTRSGPNRTVTQLTPVHPGKVLVELVMPTDDNPSGKLFHIETKFGRQTGTTDTVFHLPYLAVDGYEGLRPLLLSRQVLGVALAAEQTAASFYANGSLLSGVLEVDAKLDAEQAGRLKNGWRQRISGARTAGDIAVLDAGAKFRPISIPPEDAELLASRQFGVTEIARLFGVPPHLLGDVSGSTSWGSGIEQQFIGWVQTSLGGWITMAEQRINRELLPGGEDSPLYAEYILEGLLRGDSASRADFYSKAIQWGWMNRNEVRVRENMQPTDELDGFLTPMNMAITNDDGTVVGLGGAQTIEVDDGDTAG